MLLFNSQAAWDEDNPRFYSHLQIGKVKDQLGILSKFDSNTAYQALAHHDTSSNYS